LLAAIGAGAAAVAAPRRVQMAPLVFSDRMLGNGLRVIGVPDAGAGAVAVQLWYRVGGKDDPPGRSGFAHLFEHMMFKSARHLRAEQFDRLTEDVGGQNNAFTTEDATVYQSEVPANHLERLLWAEAERLAHLNVDQLNFDSERSVVIEELRERVLAQPYGRLFEALYPAAFDEHPYRRGVIGSIEDLRAATLEDVRAFHATYYRSDNAVLVVAGGFEPPRLDAWVDRYFGPIARPAAPVPRVNVTEAPRARDERRELKAPNVPLPALAIVWKGPRARHPDAMPLRMASALLSAGDSARLNEALVYRARIAQQAGFSADLSADAGMIVAYSIAAAGQSLAASERALHAEIRRLATAPIAEAELDKVRAQLLTSTLTRRQTPAGRAAALGQAVLVYDDPRRADRELPELQAVRAGDVQRVLREHVLGRRSVTVGYTAAA
jgi:zinc protease